MNDFWAAILGFFSDLILFTAGIFVILLWIAIIAIIAIETWDFLFHRGEFDDVDEEDLYQ